MTARKGGGGLPDQLGHGCSSAVPVIPGLTLTLNSLRVRTLWHRMSCNGRFETRKDSEDFAG